MSRQDRDTRGRRTHAGEELEPRVVGSGDISGIADAVALSVEALAFDGSTPQSRRSVQRIEAAAEALKNARIGPTE